jgi:adenosylhomocysteine nucleosidase
MKKGKVKNKGKSEKIFVSLQSINNDIDMKIGIIVAMDKELRQLQQLFTDGNVIVRKCGIGKVNAALGAQQLINEFHPDIIISSGCAGGNGDDINIQDVIASSELTYHDVYCGTAIDNENVYGQVQGLPARYQADARLLEKAKALDCGVKVHPGLVVTGDWFVDTKEKMRSIIEKFPDAKAVDMESCAIAQTCYLNKVPFISFRIISDIPLRDTDASQYHDFWDHVADHSFQVTKTFVEQL